jgi:bacillithiol disulfide reductase
VTEHHHAAIIGAGPIGIELAVAMKQAGVDYVHFDAGQIGSTIAWYPIQMLFHSSADRLSLAGVPIQEPMQQKPTREEYLAYLRAIVMQFDLKIRTYERVESAARLPRGGFELRTRAVDGEHRVRADNVVLAVGAMHVPKLLNIPGEELPHVHHYFRDPHDYFAKKLLVVGGRNSAIEAAVRCQRAGAEVTLSHRGADFDPKSVKFWLLPEIRSMIRDGRVRHLPQTCPLEVGRGTVRLVSMASGDEQIVDADFVLAMTGYRQSTPLFEMLGVAMEGPDRKPHYDPETMETNVDGVFIAGTAIAGTPVERVSVIVETCHVHVPRIVGAITGRRVVTADGPTDE